jgi:hypothetical protein
MSDVQTVEDFLVDHKANCRYLMEVVAAKLQTIDRNSEGKPANQSDVVEWRQLNFALTYLRTIEDFTNKAESKRGS